MELSVETFWVIYIVTLLILAIILFAISRKGNVKLSIGIFIAALIAGIFTGILIFFNIDPATLTPSQMQTLNLLYGTMAVVALLALFWMLFDVIGGASDRWNQKVTVTCDEKECKTKTEDIHPQRVSQARDEVDLVCDDLGCRVTGMTPHHSDESLSITYLLS